MFSKKKLAAVAMIGALSIGQLGSASSAMADTGHAMGMPPQISTVLSQLVTKGTITQAQSDAITAAINAAAPAAGAPSINGGKGMDRKMGGIAKNPAARDAVITSTLGITAADLQAARTAGKSLATLAGDKTSALITALVNFETTQIDAAVTAGSLTAAQATQIKSGLTAHVTEEVNRVGGPKGGKMGGAPKIPSSGASTTGAKNVTRTVTKTVTKSKA